MLADLAKMLSSVTFVLARHYRCRVKAGCADLLSKTKTLRECRASAKITRKGASHKSAVFSKRYAFRNGVGGSVCFGWKITNRTFSKKKRKWRKFRISVALRGQVAECAPKKEEETSARWRGANVNSEDVALWFSGVLLHCWEQFRLRQHKEQEGHKKQVGRPQSSL